MTWLEMRTGPFTYIPLLEGKKYDIGDFSTRIQSACLNRETLIPPSLKNITTMLENCKELSKFVLHETSNLLQFDFVGMLYPTEINSSSILDHEIMFLVFPKWTKLDRLDSEKAQSVMSRLMQGLFLYLRSSTRERRSQQVSKSFRSLNQYSNNLHSMRTLIHDIHTHGILKQRVKRKSNTVGRANWRTTFREKKPFWSNGTPYFLTPSREKFSMEHSKLSDIQQECYNVSMTFFSRFFNIPNSLPFTQQTAISQVNQKLSFVSKILLGTKVQKFRKRIQLLKNFLQRQSASRQAPHLFAVSSKTFNYVWENMLLWTIGDVQLTVQMNKVLNSHRPFIERKRAKQVKMSQQGHEIDSACIVNNRFVLFDAKNYLQWTKIGIDVLTKQYAYEAGINMHTDYDVALNLLIFPYPRADPLDDTLEFNVLGRYKLSYLDQLSSENHGPVAVEVNPYSVLDHYVNRSRKSRVQFQGVVAQLIPD
jgi:hypothetical protein